MNENNYYKIEKIINYLTENFKEQPGLDTLAKEFNTNQFHLQKIFTEWVGISPKKFVQYLTSNYLKNKILDFKNIDQLSDNAGLSAQSRVYDLFVNIEGLTPNEYKSFGENIVIEYGTYLTVFGDCLIAITERGLTHLSFITDNPESNLQALKKQWFKSKIINNQEKISKIGAEIFRNNEKINLFLKGTRFQLKVWEAILKIPEGNLVTYQGIGEIISNPKAVRAIGSAVGANNIGLIIPCHRVIRKSGIIGDYRWGSERKKALIGFEMVKSEKLNASRR